MAQGCSQPWAHSVRTGDAGLSLREAVFGLSVPQSYDEWAAHPMHIQMCRQHYRQVHRRDGYTLGYRLRDGKMQVYVKEEHY